MIARQLALGHIEIVQPEPPKPEADEDLQYEAPSVEEKTATSKTSKRMPSKTRAVGSASKS